MESRRNYEKDKYNNDLNFKIGKLLRGRVKSAIKNNQKVGSAVKDLGCSIKEFKLYLEKQFYPHPETGENMTWDNWASDGWHIDHIKPLSKFDLSNKKQFLLACNYTNLQPLWAKENLSKGAKTE